MDSLLANYASSDEEDQQPPHQPSRRTGSEPSSSSSLLSSLPKPKPQTSSLFSSLPKPKPQPPSSFQSLKQTQSKPSILDDHDDDDGFKTLTDSKPTPKPSVFSSLPPPKTLISNQPITNPLSSAQNPKRVVQFKPPIYSQPIRSSQSDDEAEDDDEEERRRRKGSDFSAQKMTPQSFISSLSAPRHSATLGVGSGSGSGRRAVVETESVGSRVEGNSGVDIKVESHEIYQNTSDQSAVGYESYSGYEGYIDPNAVKYETFDAYENYPSGMDQSVDVGVPLQAGISGSDAKNYGDFDGYGSYGGYEQNGSDWVAGSETAVAVIPGTGRSGIKAGKKRGRNEAPTEIVEVTQDDLMKNRPREDQAKMTGIAFGPSYQPVSTKGKPTKLHKRKHQIGSLYFDMKQKEMELAERRSKGFLTKAETQAKYGW